MRAAHAYLEGTYDSPGAAADAYGCQRQLVNYYVRKMANAGVTRSTSASSEARELEFNVEEETSAPPQDELAAYKEAYKYAGKMLRKVGRRKAAAMANEKYGVTLSASTALRASQAQGSSPVKAGAPLIIPKRVETKLEDLCLVLREMNLPVFKSMVLTYMNTLLRGTDVALKLKHREVRKHWYYNWLARCTRLETANIRPLELARAEWGTSANVKKHYDLVADVLMKTGIAIEHPAYDPKKPNCERLVLLKPERLFSMDETRLTNDTTEKNKSKINRSIISKGGSRDVVANKGGGDGTGIGGSSADGKDLPGFFIFSHNIIHGDDVRPGCFPVCRRPDPANPRQAMPSRFYCNEKGSVTGDVGLRYVKGCIQPCIPDVSPDNPAVLIMDGHGSHFTLDLLTYCRQIGLHIVLRPPHTTHLLQGEDVVHFRYLKEEYHQAKLVLLARKVLSGSCRLTTAELLQAAKTPWENAFSQQRVLDAWRLIGISPFTQCVYWSLLNSEVRARDVAELHELHPELLTVKGMVGILYGSQGDPQVEGATRRSRKMVLHSSNLWDRPGGATADECYELVQQAAAAKEGRATAVHERKKARAECRMQKSAELLQRGSTLANLLRHEGQLARLTVHDVMSALAFRGVQIPKGAKKPELIELLRANLQLPSGSSNTVNTIDAVACDDVGAYACDAGPSGFASDARADMLTCADSDNDESSGSES